MYEKNVNTFNDIPLKTFRTIVSVSSKIFFLSGKQKTTRKPLSANSYLVTTQNREQKAAKYFKQILDGETMLVAPVSSVRY